MSFIKKIVLFINILAAIGMITAGFSTYVNPQTSSIIPFFGLLYPWLLAINIFFVFFWIVGRLKYATLSLLAILITIPVLKTYVAFRLSEKRTTSAEKAFRVMSYNIRNFDLYNWNREENTLEKIIELIGEEKPDVICFQEFFNADTGKFQTIKALLEECGFSDFRFMKTVEQKNYGAWGIATFSRYPIANHSLIRFENSPLNSALYTDVQTDSMMIRIFNVHLQSVYLSKQDHEYLLQISEEQNLKVEPSRKIATKLKEAFIKRSVQAIRIDEEISESPYPVILCGDFNDPPSSFCYHTISRKLSDPFLAMGSGIGATYSGFLAVYRIDYILTDEQFEVTRYKTICEKFSDHYPVVCSLLLQ